MVQQLQALNTFLTCTAMSIVAFYFFSLQSPPRGGGRFDGLEKENFLLQERPPLVPEFIFQNDLFSTFNPSEPLLRAQKGVQPMPLFSWGNISIPPEQKETEILPALSIILNGIVLASNDETSIAVISDETLKERVYYVGDQIKDAFIAKIMKNKVVLFRSNGQQETFFLRKEDEGMLVPEEVNSEWSKVVIPLKDNEYQIDVEQFRKKVTSLGALFELFRFIPIINNGTLMGMQCEEKKKFEMIQAFGLKVHDIVVSINNIILADDKKMLKAYEEAVNTKEGGTIEVKIMRQNQEVLLTYLLKRIVPEMPASFSGKAIDMVEQGESGQQKNVVAATPVPPVLNRPHARQEKMQQRAMIEDVDSSDYHDTVMKIRKRLIDNMHKRSPHTYVR